MEQLIVPLFLKHLSALRRWSCGNCIIMYVARALQPTSKPLFKVAIAHVVQSWCVVGKLVKTVCGQENIPRAIARDQCEHQITKSIRNHLRFTCVPFWKKKCNTRKTICATFGNAMGICAYMNIFRLSSVTRCANNAASFLCNSAQSVQHFYNHTSFSRERTLR